MKPVTTIPIMPQPWYHEHAGPSLFNSWSWTHFAWGMAARKYGTEYGIGFWFALLLHTFYELVEGRLFPIQHRDPSMLNHVGDTIAFAAGWGVA